MCYPFSANNLKLALKENLLTTVYISSIEGGSLFCNGAYPKSTNSDERGSSPHKGYRLSSSLDKKRNTKIWRRVAERSLDKLLQHVLPKIYGQ